MTIQGPDNRPMSSREAGEEIRKCSGTQFDPALAEMFLQII